MTTAGMSKLNPGKKISDSYAPIKSAFLENKRGFTGTIRSMSENAGENLSFLDRLPAHDDNTRLVFWLNF